MAKGTPKSKKNARKADGAKTAKGKERMSDLQVREKKVAKPKRVVTPEQILKMKAGAEKARLEAGGSIPRMNVRLGLHTPMPKLKRSFKAALGFWVKKLGIKGTLRYTKRAEVVLAGATDVFARNWIEGATVKLYNDHRNKDKSSSLIHESHLRDAGASTLSLAHWLPVTSHESIVRQQGEVKATNDLVDGHKKLQKFRRNKVKSAAVAKQKAADKAAMETSA